MKLTIYLQKEVPDEATAEQIVALVVQRLEDHPDVKVTANIHQEINGN